jgi:xanthine dehydrogenase accessory factor
VDGLRIYEEIARMARAGEAGALALVVDASGSSPRKAGAKMVVRGDGSILGTVGGGRVEAETIAAALEAIGAGVPRTLSFSLTEENGFVCGGSMRVYVEPLSAGPRLLVFGAGHVGRALAGAAAFAGFRVTVADERPEFAARELIPEAEETVVGDPAAVLSRIRADAGTFIVVATTDHRRDFDAVRAALRTPVRYIGVVGSRRKRALLLETLAKEGVPPEELAKIAIPAGLPIGAETPAEIAVSIVAQLVESRRGHGEGSLGNRSGSRRVEPDGAVQAAPAAG